MSWALEEWKEGLPTRALQKIQELEGQLDKLKKEKQQRQFQLDTLEAALQKQKQKVETEKTEGTNLKRENQRLMEICENLEKTKQKISHELQVKESQVNFQEGQLNSGKKQIEKLEQELKRCKTDLERSQQAAQSGDASLSTPQRTFATPLTPSQHYSGSKYEDLKEKYNKEVEERKRLEAEVRALQAKRGSQAVPQTSMNHRDIARHQASSSVFSWQQERTPNRLSSHPQKTPSRRDFSASHIFGEEEVTPSRSVLQTGHRDANSSWHNSSCGSPLLGQLKSQNQELRSKVNELELRLQGQEKEMKSQAHRFQELQLQLEKTKAELIEKDKVLNKNRDELVKTSAQHDQAATKCTALEQKLKKLTEDMSCQRQNAESARCSLEQRVKEKEKELQEELSRQQRAFQTLDQESTQMKARLTQELQQAKNTLCGLEAELDKVSSAKLQLEKNLEEFKQKCSRMEQASEERQVEEQALRSSSQEMKKENGFLRAQSEQRAREVSHLEEELRKARVCLSQSQNFTEEMRAKNASQETMMRELQEKINQQENSFTLEKLKLTLADLEKQRDCSQDLLKKREHHIEQLNEKLSKMEKESKALMSALELTKKEYEELNEEKTQFSRWRSENEKLLHQMESEKESLQSKVHHLEMCLKTQQIKSHEYNERVRTLEMERDNLGVEMRNLCSVVDSKTREAEMQKQAYEGLQQKAELSEQKHKKEMENLCMKTSQLTGQVEDLEQRLQLLSSELLDKAQHYQELQAEYENLRDLFKSKESARSQGDHQSSCLAFEQQSAMSASFVNVMGEQGSNSLERSRCLLDADPSPKSPAILHSRVISLEFSLESQKQMNSDLQKQCEELVHIKEEIEENLIKAEQMHESFVAETSQCICKLQEDTSVHQNVVAETLVALENKEKELQLWKARLEVEQVEIQELKKSNQLLEDSLKELQLLCETLSSEKKEMSSIISLSKKEIEELTQENGTLKEMNEILNQEKMNLLQKNEKFSNCIEKQEKSISELSDQYKQERLFLLQRCEETGSAFEDLSEKYKAAQEKNLRLECLLNECNSVSESRKNELEQLKATFAKEHQEFFTKLAFAEEENQKLILEFEVVQQALKSEIRDLRSSSKSETDALQQEITALKEGQNKMQKEVNDLFQENEQRMKLTKTKHEGQHLELEPVRDPVNERESEIDMCSFQLHTDLGVEDIAPNNSNAQMVQLEALIGNTELNPQESEKEKESLQQEVQTLKGELKAGNLQGRSSQEMSGLMDCEADAEGKYSAVLCELSPRQGDHAHWRCSSLQAALSKLGELEKMCEMLQVEKLQLVSELNDSRAECITATSRMAEEVEKLVNEMKILNDDNGLPQAESVGEMPANEFDKWKNEQTLVSSNPLDTSNSYEQLTLSNKEVQTHFAELQEKFSSLLSEHKILHDQRCQMSSKMSELWSYVDTLKAENSALSVNLRNLQSDSAKEMKPEEHVLSLSFSCVTNSPSVTSFGESSFYKDVLEQTGDTSFLSNLGESVPTNASLEEECLTTKEAPATAERSVEELETLCQGYLRSLKNLQEEMESQAMVKDKEIQELGELLSSERTELDCLRKQYLSQNEQWQQKLTSVTLEMESKLAAEKQQTEHLSLELEVARLQLQGLELSSQSLLGADNEEAIQSQNGSYDIKESEEYTSEITEKTPKRDSHQICEEVVQQDLSVESEETTEGPRVPQGAREVPSETTDDTAVGVRGQGCLQHTSELSSCGPHALAPMEFVENQVSIQTLQLQVKEASNENLRLLHALEDRDRKVENLLNEIKELDSRLDLQELQLRTKIKMCLQLEKIVEELKKEKCNLSEKLESFSRADQELGPRVETSEALSSNLEMGTDDSPQEVLEENVPMVDESRKDGFLAVEIKAEDAGIEHRALAMEADLEVAQNEKLCLERDKENCQKVIVHLEEELSVATSERNRLHGELDTVTKENRTLAQMSEAMKEKVQALEAEVRDKAAVLQTLSSQLSELSADRGDLQKQLRRLEGDSQALSSAARELESQVGRLDKEKESLARESESLQAKLNELEQERLSASRALEVALMEKDELAERLGSTQQEVHQLRKGMEKLRVRIEADEKKQLHVLEKLKGCERDNDALRDKVEGLQRELQMSEENQELVILDAENAKAEAESLRAQVDEMAESLRGSRVDLTTLRSEKGDLTKQLQEQQGQASKLEARLSSLQSLVEEKEQARAHMQEESRTAVEMIQAQVRELTEEVAALCQDQGTPKAEEQNLDAPGNEVPRLRYSLGRLRARLDADREKQLRVLGQLKGSECCVQLLQGSVESLQRELELSGRSQEQAVREAENSKAEVETLKAEIQEISQNLRDLKVDLVNTKSEKEDLTRGLQKEQARVSELEIRNSSLENLLQEKEHQNVQVKEESEVAVETLQAQLKLLNEKVVALCNDQEACKTKEQSLSSQVDSLEVEKAHLLQDLEGAKRNYVTLQSSVNGLMQEVEDGKQELERKDEELSRLQGQVQDQEQLASQLSQVEGERQLWQKQKVELEQKVQGLQSQNHTLRDSLEALQNSCQELERELSSTKVEKISLVERVNTMTAKEAELQAEMQDMVQKTTELKEEFSGEKNRLTAELNVLLGEIKSSKTDHLKYVDQLKKENERAQGKIKLLLKSCRQLEEEKKMLQKELSQGEAAQKQNTGALEANVDELRAEIRELKETLEDRAKEADEYLDKYCSLLISHEKLEKAKEMLETQVARLSSQHPKHGLSGSPLRSSATPEPSPAPLVGEGKSSSGQSKASGKRQRCSGNWESGGGLTPSTPETFPKKSRTVVGTGGIHPAKDEEFEPEGLPEVVKKGFADIPTGKTSPYVLRRTTMATRTSPRLAAQKSALSPLSAGKENLAESSKPTAGGSRSQKVKVAQRSPAGSAEPTVKSASVRHLSGRSPADSPRDGPRTRRSPLVPRPDARPQPTNSENCRVQ